MTIYMRLKLLFYLDNKINDITLKKRLIKNV